MPLMRRLGPQQPYQYDPMPPRSIAGRGTDAGALRLVGSERNDFAVSCACRGSDLDVCTVAKARVGCVLRAIELQQTRSMEIIDTQEGTTAFTTH
jgi:hypothetical protein